jgi:hypothetical protein
MVKNNQTLGDNGIESRGNCTLDLGLYTLVTLVGSIWLVTLKWEPKCSGVSELNVGIGKALLWVHYCALVVKFI